MRIAEPLAFIALALVPLIIFAHLNYARRLAKRIDKAGDASLIDQMSSLGSTRGQSERLLSTVCFALAMIFITIALARPQFGLRTETRKGRGMDLVLALDLSRSMLARDVTPSRLERARAELKVLMSQLAGDRIGLVGFTSVAIPLCPLTVDHAALELQLAAASPNDMPKGGTSVTEAIGAARRMLETSPHDGGGKAILIITDGEEHLGNAATTAKDAKENGIEVHVAGVGSRTGEPIPVTDKHGRVTGYLKDKRGQTVITRLNEAALRGIASAGGGKTALPGNTGGIDLTAIRAHLSRLKKAELEERTVRVYEERYRWALLPGFILLMIGTLIRPRRRVVRRIKTPTGVKASLTSLAVVFASGLLMGAGPLEREDNDVADGNTALLEGRAEDAVKAYDRAKERLAADPRLAYNRGLAQAAAGEIDAAIEDYQSALAGSADAALRSQTNLALGNAFRKKQKLKDAITAYQQAVIENPKNVAARRNLEVTRAMKRIADLQPKPPNKDGEQGDNDDTNEDQPKQDAGVGDASTGDGGQQNKDQNQGGRDGGVGDAQQPPQDQGDGGSGQDAGASNQGNQGDAGPQKDAGNAAQGQEGKEDEKKEMDQQDVQQLLDALQQREQVLKRKRLQQKYGTKKVEKDW